MSRLTECLERHNEDLQAERDHLASEVSRLAAENASLRESGRACEREVERIKAAVQAHHDQAGDDRCHLDDLKLYHEVLGEGTDPYVGALPPTECMMESCRRYIEQRRCPGPEGVAPLPEGMTIRQLTGTVARLQEELATIRADQMSAAREVLVPIPPPGTDMARLLHANVMMRKYRIPELEAEVERLKNKPCAHELARRFSDSVYEEPVPARGEGEASER